MLQFFAKNARNGNVNGEEYRDLVAESTHARRLSNPSIFRNKTCTLTPITTTTTVMDERVWKHANTDLLLDHISNGRAAPQIPPIDEFAQEPCEPPAVPACLGIPHRQILFRHPGYNEPNNVLFKLFAPDVGQDYTSRGLYAEYALQAYGIVAGNRWDGWLSEAKDHDYSTRVDSTSILHKSRYYFHLPPLRSDVDAGRPNLPYPIVPTFREWRFPHDQLPDLWQQMSSTDSDFVAPEQSYATSNLTLALQARNISCRITGYKEGTQVAHIYTTFGSANTLDDLSNALLLRTDLHIAFDKPKFVFVPKPSSDPKKPRYVTHVVEASAELEFLYHNRALHSLYSSAETLFAQFAWSIFPLVDGFLTCRERRRLLLASENAASFDNEGFVPWERCAQFSRKRSQSPKKRKPDSGPMVDDADLAIKSDEPHPRNKRRCQHPVFHSDTHLSESLIPSVSASPASLPALDTHIPFKSVDSDKFEDSVRTTASPSSTSRQSPHYSVLTHKWSAQSDLSPSTHGQWEADKSWAKDVWTRKAILDEVKARKWVEICGAEFPDDNN
ncbi:hypothetical protein B0J11DRAFT_598420 [Dendryphion nanum]|uniref:HNH nuclease domain-containing protein n=1 Tax=Dendryphion nanum TaxID=256645 RepID=A0A9P9D378_9PLEO|nr:hypothetical protein B0J11DRAFT_598420 [Dendryphion nanum]